MLQYPDLSDVTESGYVLHKEAAQQFEGQTIVENDNFGEITLV